MFNIYVATIFAVLLHLQHPISAAELESKPNSLDHSIARASIPLPIRICNRDVNLRNEVRPALWKYSLQWDEHLTNAHNSIEELYIQIAKVLELVQNDSHLDKSARRTNLDALSALLTVLNGLEDRLESAIGLLDSLEGAIIDTVIGSLIAVNKLDCDCACPVPKNGIDLILGTANALTTCIQKKDKSVVVALNRACDSLKAIIRKGVAKSGLLLLETEIQLSTSLTMAQAELCVCSGEVGQRALSQGGKLLHGARHCQAENS